MKKNVICFFVACILLLIEASMVQGVTLFGPKKYDRTTGPPNIYNEAVYATAGAATLIFRNGAEKDKHRVTSAQVFINGRQVLFPDDFKKKTPVLEVPVNIDSRNDIRLELRGKPGTFLTLEITREAVLPPEVTLSAEPDTIMAGSSSSLFWSSSNADTCELDQDIGPVGLNEKQGYPVSPVKETTYTVTCRGPGGAAKDNATVSVLSPISLSVIGPASHITVNTPEILVHGVVINPTGKETGITVNGIPAQINGEGFYVNNLQLKEGENAITVKALDSDGNRAEAAVTVFFDASVPFSWIEMQVSQETGIVPFKTTLVADTQLLFTPAGQPVVKISGPATVMETWLSDTEIELELTVPGLYTLAYEVTDGQGVFLEKKIKVTALDQAALEVVFNEKWNSMVDALMAGDVQQAVSYFVAGNRARYDSIFSAMDNNKKNAVFGNITEIEIDSMYDRVAYCGAITVESGGTFSYPVTFVKDENGIWKILSF